MICQIWTERAKSLLKNPSVSAKWVNRPPEMRGQRKRSGSLFSYVSIKERIPASHPLRRILVFNAPALPDQA